LGRALEGFVVGLGIETGLTAGQAEPAATMVGASAAGTAVGGGQVAAPDGVTVVALAPSWGCCWYHVTYPSTSWTYSAAGPAGTAAAAITGSVPTVKAASASRHGSAGRPAEAR
jgi:hypothetical protein